MICFSLCYGSFCVYSYRGYAVRFCRYIFHQLWLEKNKGMFRLAFNSSTSFSILNLQSDIAESLSSQRFLLKNNFISENFFVINRACSLLKHCDRWSYSKQSFSCEIVPVTWIETVLRRQWWALSTKYFGAVSDAFSRRICSSECFRHCFYYLIFTWPYSNTPKGKIK